MGAGKIVIGRRRRTVEIFLTRGGTHPPAKGIAAIRKVICTAFSAVQPAGNLFKALAMN